MNRPMYFILFFSVFYAVGFGLLGYGLWSARQSTAAASWSITKGILTECLLKDSSGNEGGTTYRVEVKYYYSVGAKEFTGSRVAFGYSGGSDYRTHQQIYAVLQKAKSVDVRYDPSDPANSTLSYGIHQSIRFVLVFAITWLAFVLGFTAIWWMSSQSDNVLLRNLGVH